MYQKELQAYVCDENNVMWVSKERVCIVNIAGLRLSRVYNETRRPLTTGPHLLSRN
jgi:hypothetical protein